MEGRQGTGALYFDFWDRRRGFAAFWGQRVGFQRLFGGPAGGGFQCLWGGRFLAPLGGGFQHWGFYRQDNALVVSNNGNSCANAGRKKKKKNWTGCFIWFTRLDLQFDHFPVQLTGSDQNRDQGSVQFLKPWFLYTRMKKLQNKNSTL